MSDESFPCKTDDADPSSMQDSIRETVTHIRDDFNKARVCLSCGACTSRCELLDQREWDRRTIIALSLTYLNEALESADPALVLRRCMEEDVSFYSFFRTCSACDRCTAVCSEDLSMAAIWRRWRHIFAQIDILPECDVRIVSVDHTWDLFSAYRAVYGIDYSDLPLLNIAPVDAEDTVLPCGDDIMPSSDTRCEKTLFFPGCTLVSYVPELTRAAFNWLEERGPCLLATQCCGSPLVSAGREERADAWKCRILQEAVAQGVTRIVTVCPGCAGELARMATFVAPNIEFMAFPQMLLDADLRVDPRAVEPVPLAVADACHDRLSIHGSAIRMLLSDVPSVSCGCEGYNTFCCGAGGSVEPFDPECAHARARANMERAERSGARGLVVSCPTCSYTYSKELRALRNSEQVCLEGFHVYNYLELIFDWYIDWESVFSRLEMMWTGEYADWLAYQLL